MVNPKVKLQTRLCRRIPRFRNRWGLLVITMLAIFALAVSFGAGWILRSPSWAKQAQEQGEVVPAWAPVERRVVESRSLLAGLVQPGSTVQVTIPGTGIVTRVTRAVGEVLAPGMLAGVVAGIPYILLDGPLPLFRDLQWGDTGDDVVAVQNALISAGYDPGDVGEVNQLTLTAVRKMYAAVGFSSPLPVTTISFTQFITLPPGDRVVTAVASVATVTDPKNPLLTVRTGSAYGGFVADVSTVAEIKVGAELNMQIDGSIIVVLVTQIGEYQAAKDQTPAGRPVQVKVKNNDDSSKLKPGASFTIALGVVQSATNAVPLTAIRRDVEGEFVFRKPAFGEIAALRQRVPVQVDHFGDGWAAVIGELRPGDLVQVS